MKQPQDPTRCERCHIPMPFIAHWCVLRDCPCTEQRTPTQEMRNIIEGKAYNE